jgi:hypothetical protein
MRPRPTDTLRGYFTRVQQTRLNGIYSNLDDHCYRKYDFAGKGVDKSKMHGAEMDAYCVHLLLEEYRKAWRDEIVPFESGAPTAPFKVPVPPPTLAFSGAQTRHRGQRVN